MTSDFSNDTDSLDNIVRAFYEIVSGPAGSPRQWERDRWIHSSDARILIPDDSGAETVYLTLTLAEYHARANRHERLSFFEEEIARRTEPFGQMAHVWSTYHWRTQIGGKIEGRGINSIQLYQRKERWWISSWMFFNEKSAYSIPAHYLVSK